MLAFAGRGQVSSVVRIDPESTKKTDAPITFYRRKLPSSCIRFSSPEGKKLFREALEQGGMEGYFSLAEQFRTQDEPAYCGLSTLTMVLNALSIDPGRVWKGPWRWFHETMLDCCQPLEVVQKNGLTFDELACLATCNGTEVAKIRAEGSSVVAFRRALKATSADCGCQLIVSYSRVVLGQTGDGHFSPIGGFHEPSDQVLIMDVARFKYPPHWVKVELLFEAMLRHDKTTNKSRGFMLLRKSSRPSGILFSLQRVRWSELRKMVGDWETHLQGLLRKLLTAGGSPVLGLAVSGKGGCAQDTIPIASGLSQTVVTAMLNWLCDSPNRCIIGTSLTQTDMIVDPEHKKKVEALLLDVRQTQLYQTVCKSQSQLSCVAGCSCANNVSSPATPAAVESGSSICSGAELCTVMLLLLPKDLWKQFHPNSADDEKCATDSCAPEDHAVFRELSSPAALPASLRMEVDHLGQQLSALCCAADSREPPKGSASSKGMECGSHRDDAFVFSTAKNSCCKST